MTKKIFIVSASPRKGGNSDTLADEFARGAMQAGHTVEKVNVRDADLKFCTGCMYCQSHGGCALNDGMNALYERIGQSDVLVFATPVYYYSVSGQLKTFLDRLNPLYSRRNKFKSVYLIATAADDDEAAFDGCVSDIRGWVDCFNGVKFKGALRGAGVENAGDVNETELPAQAFAMGKSL